MRDLTIGGMVEAVGRTGVLAHKAAEVSWVTRRALEMLSAFAELEDVRNTFLSLDLNPEKQTVNHKFIL